MGVMSNPGEMEIDTAQTQRIIVQNMSAEEKAKLQHVENVMTRYIKRMHKAKTKKHCW